MVPEDGPEVITTSVDDEVKSLEEQLAAIQGQMAAKRKDQEEERSEKRAAVIAEVVSAFEADLMDIIDDDVLDALEAVGAVGVSILREKDAEGGVPTRVLRPILAKAKAATRAASTSSTGNGEGKNRPLEQIFRGVATPEQVAWLEANKADRGTDGRGARNGFMNRVINAADPAAVPVPVARGS